MPNLTYSVSATTRAPREGELDGVHYFFVKHDEFVSRMEAGDFLETAEFCGNYYGTPRSLVERSLSPRCLAPSSSFSYRRRTRNSERG